MHWGSDDLFVLPELEDLERCLRDDYAFETDKFAIPSENSHLELMMRLGQLIKEHESPDTLFVVYYGGHARIDESRQSTWCATREPDSPWLQWSAIQTLLERSKSDVLILLDCCAGAASATFPTGNSITETISASSWDAIAPDPGRYSFTNALIEVLTDWRRRTFSAAMLHAEVLARLKHPRPITINGKHFEARSTPVHFMMTANHRAPSIEMSRVGQALEVQSPAILPTVIPSEVPGGPPLITARGPGGEVAEPVAEPNEDTPHVMISLALEDDQKLDINAWEQWLNAFPALAKHVKVQGVFKSHSTLLLVSMPVMVWDMLPDDQAVSFVAFIRSNNLAIKNSAAAPRAAASSSVPVSQSAPAIRTAPVQDLHSDATSFMTGVTGTTFVPADSQMYPAALRSSPRTFAQPGPSRLARNTGTWHLGSSQEQPSSTEPATPPRYIKPSRSAVSLSNMQQQQDQSLPSVSGIAQQVILNQQQSMRRTTFRGDIPPLKKFSRHIESRLEGYYQKNPYPNDAELAMQASNLGIEPAHLAVWYHHRREQGPSDESPTLLAPEDFASLAAISRHGETLIFDIRPEQDYTTSHVVKAINLRAPQSFLEHASLDLIQRAVPPSSGQEDFYTWREARALVFYGTDIHTSADCPAAQTIHAKLTEQGWRGDCFIVRGSYADLPSSLSSLHSSPAPLDDDSSRPFTPTYRDLLANLTTFPEAPAQLTSSYAAQQALLETELRSRAEDVWLKAQALRAEPATAEFVDALDRGLDKMRGEMQSQTPSPRATGKAPEGYFEVDESGDYVKVHQNEGASYEEARRGRGGLLNKMFRR